MENPAKPLGRRPVIRPERAVKFTQPVRQIVMMLTVLGLVAAGAWLILPTVTSAFLSNPWLNGFILFVFALGVLACVWQVWQLSVSVSWIEDFVAQRPGHVFVRAPRLLAPLATLLRAHGVQTQISASSSRSILDSVGSRIDEARDITRYLVNLLIFLGLLGTFYGLASTVPAIVETIRGLAPQDGESGVAVFGRMMGGLERQLGGMSTAFSSSLLGLAGSLVVGLLELFASHGQNRFYRELEEWLSTITRLGIASGEAEAQTDVGALVGVLDQLAQQIDTMAQRSAEERARLAEGIDTLASGLTRLIEREAGGSEQTRVLERIAEGQDRLAATLAATLADAAGGPGGVDAESRMRLRSIDTQLLRILEEMAAGRQESIADLRADLGALTAAIRQMNRTGGGTGTRG